jgi:hypothetical protein
MPWTLIQRKLEEMRGKKGRGSEEPYPKGWKWWQESLN